MRTSERNVLAASAVLAVMPAACSPASDRTQAPRVPCAQGSGALALQCTVERTATDRGMVLTLRSPDGGFRRLLVTRDGRGVVAADGAEPAVVTLARRGAIDVRIGGDRYRLPATVEARH